jgi:hypothetical protein
MSTKKNAPPKKAAAKKSAPPKGASSKSIENYLKGRNPRTRNSKAIMPGEYFALLFEKDKEISLLRKENLAFQQKLAEGFRNHLKEQTDLINRHKQEREQFQKLMQGPGLRKKENYLPGDTITEKQTVSQNVTNRGITDEQSDNKPFGELTSQLVVAAEHNNKIRDIIYRIENQLKDRFDFPVGDEDPKVSEMGRRAPLPLTTLILNQQNNIGPRLENILNFISKVL